MALTFGSLFSGIGGFDLGFERAGMRCRWQVEINQKARSVLVRHWPAVTQYEDVKRVGSANLGTVDVVCGGFPCQDVSVAGLRKGLAGERSGLWREFHRIVAECRPRWFVIENVPGLLSSDGRRDMGAILAGLAELGYLGAYRVLDAQFFGVAQRRRRVFIVGRAGDGRAVEVLFESTSRAWDLTPSRQAGTVPAALSAHGVGATGPDDNQAQAGHLVSHALGAHHGHYDVSMDMVADGVNDRKADAQCLAVREVASSVTSAYAKNSADSGLTSIPNWARDVSASLMAGGMDTASRDTNRRNIMAGRMIRRLTPTECERLQGFPDGWTAGQTDTQRYRQLGNAVCVPVAEWIGRRLVAAELGQEVLAWPPAP